jgi:hypothetical protein
MTTAMKALVITVPYNVSILKSEAPQANPENLSFH